MSDTISSEVITIRVPLELKQKIEKVAAREDRSISYIGNKALLDLIAREEEVVRLIQEGVDDLKAGRLTPHDDVIKAYEKRKAKYFKDHDKT